MTIKPWMILAAGVAAWWFLARKKTAQPERLIQTQNLYIDP